MIEALILCGGKGERLKEITKGIIPKAMVQVNKKPFLYYIINQLKHWEIRNLILLVGYKKELIIDYFGDGGKFGVNIKYSIENNPMGTGGAIKLAENLIQGKKFFLLNGDTFLDINFQGFLKFQIENNADVAIAVKFLENSNRYGIVKFNRNKIISFSEKSNLKSSFVNLGIYIFEKSLLLDVALKPSSLERDLLPYFVSEKNVFGYMCNGYFIDIGIPNDFKKANKEFIANYGYSFS